MLHVLDLFSGIGGFSLGLERTGGFKTVAFCETDGFCQKVLRKHWADVPIYDDVKELDYGRLQADGIPTIDIITGGFPCQPVSYAGRQAGKEDDRWLWPEFARLIGEIRPKWVLGENVPGLLSNDSGRLYGGILRDLAQMGYDVEWFCISAADMGAPHLRKRIWILAYPQSQQMGTTRQPREAILGFPPNTVSSELWEQPGRGSRQEGESSTVTRDYGKEESLPNPTCQRSSIQQGQRKDLSDEFARDGKKGHMADTTSVNTRHTDDGKSPYQTYRILINQGRLTVWDAEPDVGRVANGIPSRVDRLRALGNAIVPQIAELLGEYILL